MKLLFLCLMAIFSTVDSYAGLYDSVIIPINLAEVQDSTIYNHVSAILKGEESLQLYDYKKQCRGNSVNFKFKSWEIYAAFSTKTCSKISPSSFNILSYPDSQLIADIAFYHVKSMLDFTPQSLSSINDVLAEKLGTSLVTCNVEAFISKDYLKHYLHIKFTTEGSTLDLVLIKSNGLDYSCVIQHS